MKKIFLEYLKNQLSQDEKLRSANSIAEEDRVILDEHIASLTSTIEAIEALEDAQVSQEVVDELKASLETLNETVKAITEKLNQNKTEETEMEIIAENYLKSQNAIHDFAQTIRNTKTADEFAKNWAEVLRTNGISVTEGSEEAYLPEAVRGKIQDAWDRNAAWLSKVNFTGAKRFYCRYNSSDQEDETSRAKGHTKGQTKASQSLELAAKVLEAQFIYKIQDIDNQTIWENDEELINYVLGELVDQILYEIKRAILVGDGRASNSNYKINKIEAITSHTSTDAWVTVSTETADGFLIDDIRAAVDSIKNENGKEILVFVSKSDLRTISRVQASDTASPVYISKEDVATQLGENVTIITTDLLGDDYKAIAMIPDEYYMVGENVLTPRLAQWEDYMKNITYWRYECAVGGGINGLKSAAVVEAGE